MLRFTCVVLALGALQVQSYEIAANYTTESPDDVEVSAESGVEKGPQIVGGTAASLGMFPWQVALWAPGNSFCGGSIISPNYVLTAAHCIENAGTYTLMYGAVNTRTSDSNRVTRRTTTRITHPQYNKAQIANDVGLLYVSQAVQYNQYIRPIALPTAADESSSFVNWVATVSGWGHITDGGSTTNELRYVQAPVISNAQCQRTFRAGLVLSSNICTSGESIKGICSGDSGGPLVVRGNDGNWKQIGIVSFMVKDQCARGHPSVFARVSSYRRWIATNARLSL